MKLKSHKGTKKRVKVRKSGKLAFRKAAKRHLLINKSKRQKNKHKSGMPVNAATKAHIKKLLPGTKIK